MDTYRKPPSLYRMVPSLTPYDAPFTQNGGSQIHPPGTNSRRVLPPSDYDERYRRFILHTSDVAFRPITLAVVVCCAGSSVDPNDIRQALSVWPVNGRPCVPAALRTVRRSVFTRGARTGTVPSVAVLVTDADTPFNYTDWVTAANELRAADIELYVVSVGNGPYPVAMAAVARNATRVINIPSVDDVAAASGRMLTRLCL